MIATLSQTQKDAPTDAISNNSSRTIGSTKTINVRGTIPLETRLNPKKDGICHSIAVDV